ncbi:hypothetical protein XF30_26350 [Bradyrhizobium sp. SUTN9-2]|nr:hypothetical protein XF30_26350 [Bradyrhizobium sp. SUTN9-2]
MHGALVSRRRRTRAVVVLRIGYRFETGIGQAVLQVRVIDQALADPVSEIAEAPDGADFIAAPVVFDLALAHAVDISGVVVEIADQGPDVVERVVQHGAVIGLGHRWLAFGFVARRGWLGARTKPTRFPTAHSTGRLLSHNMAIPVGSATLRRRRKAD